LSCLSASPPRRPRFQSCSDLFRWARSRSYGRMTPVGSEGHDLQAQAAQPANALPPAGLVRYELERRSVHRLALECSQGPLHSAAQRGAGKHHGEGTVPGPIATGACGNTARTDPCGDRPAIVVPAATAFYGFGRKCVCPLFNLLPPT
jgi:hypothetical protein